MITLRDYQKECNTAFHAHYIENDAHGIVVVPTAGGKSLLIGSLCKELSDSRILILSHVRELIKQNHEKVMLCNPRAAVGIYSAALKRRQPHHPVVVATIQSVYKKAELLGHRDYLLIDEAHLIQPAESGMYRSMIADLAKINPQIKICGFTATAYRADSGELTEGDLFKKIIIDIPIQRLMDEGYLTPPIANAPEAQADMSGVKIMAGEYNIKEMAQRFDQVEFLNAALDNDMKHFINRRSIALFCANIENAEHVADGMNGRGIECEVITGEMPQDMRDDKLSRFRSGILRALASVDTMTTGTDVPNIDCLVLLRATRSPGLYQQIIGRGFRVVYADGYDLSIKEGRLAAIKAGPKSNFLVLDHGGNIERHGPITNVQKPDNKKKRKGEAALKMLVRICKICRTANPLEARICMVCDKELIEERDTTKELELQASSANILGTSFSRGEVPGWFNVGNTEYYKQPNGSIHIQYYCDNKNFNENWHFTAKGFLGQIAIQRWNMALVPDYPRYDIQNGIQAMHHIKLGALRKPKRIQVMKVKDKKYYEIMRYEY